MNPEKLEKLNKLSLSELFNILIERYSKMKTFIEKVKHNSCCLVCSSECLSCEANFLLSKINKIKEIE